MKHFVVRKFVVFKCFDRFSCVCHQINQKRTKRIEREQKNGIFLWIYLVLVDFRELKKVIEKRQLKSHSQNVSRDESPGIISYKYTFDFSCYRKCILSEKTILSIGCLYYQIKSQHGGEYLKLNRCSESESKSIRLNNTGNMVCLLPKGHLRSIVGRCPNDGQTYAKGKR